MEQIVKDVAFKLFLMDKAEYEHDDLLDKSREDLENEFGELDTFDIVDILGSHGEEVQERFEEGGRWHNVKHTVSRYRHNRELVYLEITEELPATEMQEGGDFNTEIERVYPHKIETTEYKSYPQTKGASK